MSQDDLAEEFIQLVPEDAEFEVRAKDVLTVLIDVELSENEVYPKIINKKSKNTCEEGTHDNPLGCRGPLLQANLSALGPPNFKKSMVDGCMNVK